jgi:sugar lactone lactonase YvrE
MKSHFHRWGLLVLTLLLATSSAVSAGEVAEPVDPYEIVHRASPPSRSLTALPPVGDPGLVYSYERTFGVLEQPYLADYQHLNRPIGLFIDPDDNLFVVEENGTRLLKFNSSGVGVLSIGHAGVGWHHDDYLAWPKDVAVDSQGHIWVLMDPALKEIAPDGSIIKTFPEYDPWIGGQENDRFDYPFGVAFDSSGLLYVGDSNNHRIQVYQIVDGTPVYNTTLGTTGVAQSDNSGFNFPTQLAFDSLGRLYVMDSANQRVQRCTFTPGWECETFFGETGVPGDDLQHLSVFALGITIANDDIFIADWYNARVLKCTTLGTCTLFAGVTGEPGSDNDHLYSPADVAVDSQGNVFVTEWSNNRIQKFSPSGEWLATLGVTGVPYVADDVRMYVPWGVAVAHDGGLIITENSGSRVLKYNQLGEQVWAKGQAGVFGPDNNFFWTPAGNPGIDSAGNIYVTDSWNHRLQILNPDGAYLATIGITGFPGQDNYLLDCPTGAAINPTNGDILIADTCNHRVQVFSSSRIYKTTIGVTAEPGSDNAHFNTPQGVAVDSQGNLYVADRWNFRVQKCVPAGQTYTCSTFTGQTGSFGNEFGQLNPALAVAVDTQGRVFVADEYNNRVQVFDAQGRYLTSIDGSWGQETSQSVGILGVAVDGQGNVYAVDSNNHRVKKYSPGYPAWNQVNIDGYGTIDNAGISELIEWNGALYASTWNHSMETLRLYRSADGNQWSRVQTNGLQSFPGHSISSMAVFNNTLYAGTFHEEQPAIFKTTNGTDWTLSKTGFGYSGSSEVLSMKLFNGYLYAAFRTPGYAGDLWRTSNGSDWSRVAENSFGIGGRSSWWTFEEHAGHLFVASSGGDPRLGFLFYSANGQDWLPATTNGFGDEGNWAILALASYKGYLYATTANFDQMQVWRSPTGLPGTWIRVGAADFDLQEDHRAYGLTASAGALYCIVSNFWEGDEVWRSTDGLSWEKISSRGWGNSDNNYSAYSDNGSLVYNNALYVGTYNFGSGGKLWRYDENNRLFLPMMRR